MILFEFTMTRCFVFIENFYLFFFFLKIVHLGGFKMNLKYVIRQLTAVANENFIYLIKVGAISLHN
jgi:hypothetical protein